MGFFLSIWGALLIALAISTDAFAASFAYGGKGIKIPFRSVLIINLVCSKMLGISLLAGEIIRPYMSETLTTGISFAILFILGIFKLFDGNTNPKNHDKDNSKVISAAEAVSLSVALSLDGLAVGLGVAMGSANILAVILCTFTVGVGAVMLGCRLGNKIAGKINVSWLSGVILIGLAFVNLL
ncbi:MAG: manganese efflux pump [Oscillospiraceae bacterium]|nr:manganese efflux pump [Oscillospiraceae bacterium]